MSKLQQTQDIPFSLTNPQQANSKQDGFENYLKNCARWVARCINGWGEYKMNGWGGEGNMDGWRSTKIDNFFLRIDGWIGGVKDGQMGVGDPKSALFVVI